jgi:hypothetical protein
MNHWRKIFKVGVNTKSCVSMRKHIQKQAPKFARELDTAFETSYAKRHYFLDFFFAWTRRVVAKNWLNGIMSQGDRDALIQRFLLSYNALQG